MLRSLTGWTLSYFAIVTKFRSKNKRFGSKRFGRADIMLWEKEVEDKTLGIKRRGAAVTFRMHEDTDQPWVTGKIGASTTIEYSSGLDATIAVSHKTRGKLLHTGKMVACSADQKHSRTASQPEADLADLVVTFEDSRCKFRYCDKVYVFLANTVWYRSVGVRHPY